MVRTPAAVRWLADWPERNPGFAFLALFFLAVVGAVLAGRLSVGHAANAAGFMFTASADLPGIDAATVEAMVTKPLEAALEGLPGTLHIEARTRVGHASFIVSFSSAVQRDRALEEARRRIATLA